MTDYTLRWFDNTEKVIIVEFKSDITWDDFHKIVDEAHSEVRKKPYEINLILWYVSSDLPYGNPMTHFKSVVKRQPDNMGKIVVINPGLNSGIGRYILMLAKMMGRIIPQTDNVELVASYEEACQKLNLPVSAPGSNDN